MNLNQARHFALYAIPCAALLAACADENTTQITEQTGLATIASGESLADCSEENSGEMVFVSDSSAVYYCDGSSWQTLNGKDGKDGADGKDCDCQKESESNVEPDSIATVILNTEIQPPIVGISLFGAYKDADEKGVLLCSDESGCSLEKSEENAYIGTKESGNTSFFGFNDPSKNTQTIKMRMEKFAYSQGYGRIVGLNGTTEYMVKAYAVLKKDTVYGTAEKFTTISFNRSPKTLDYSNVWQNSSYTIFDIATDEILSGKTYYFTSNENTNMRTSCGQVGCYKVRDSIHNDLWVQMMFGYGIHKVIIPPAFKHENGLLSITASAEIDDAVDKFYYSINGDPLDFASWTNEYTGPVKVESGDVVHAYIKTAKGYLSTPNSFIVE